MADALRELAQLLGKSGYPQVTDVGPGWTLSKLFHRGATVSREELRASLSERAVKDLCASGMLDVDPADGGRLRSTARIAVLNGVYAVHDPMDISSIPADHVAGIGPATRTLAGLTVRRRISRALDLGTGSGIQALLATRHADHVAATDLNPRAVRLAALSARLNGTQLDLRVGSLFAPVEGEGFELVAANPPFVVSPDTSLVFRDGDVAGEGISPSVVMQASQHLEDGGFATILCSWVCREGDPWSAAPSAWVDGSACDAWVLHHRSDTPQFYASTWNAVGNRDADAHVAALERWIGWYRAQGIESIETGAVILRRRRGPNWVKFDEMPDGPRGDATQHILRVFAVRDAADRWENDRAVLGSRVKLLGPHHLEQGLAHDGSHYATSPARLRLDEGVGTVADVPPHLIQLLLSVDGAHTLAQLADKAADALGSDPARYRNEAVALVRHLHAGGFVAIDDG